MNQTAPVDFFRLKDSLAVLEATPGVLQALIGDLPREWLDFQEDPEAWSPFTVLVHIIHNERTNWVPRLRVLMSDDAPRRFAPFHQLPEAGEGPTGDVPQLLQQFAMLRQESLSFVRNLRLGPAHFDREAEHPSLGSVRLRHLLATWVVHDLNHLHQTVKSLAKRYESSVGPWRQYLAILDL